MKTKMDLKQLLILFIITLEKNFVISILPVCTHVTPPECTNQPTCCRYLQFVPQTIRTPILSIFSITSKNCKCKEECFRRKSVKCVHGKCNQQRTKCLCQHCWFGKGCDQFVNKHPPSLVSSNVEVSILSDHPLHEAIYTITATDDDTKHCENKNDCPCASISFKLKHKSEIFQVNEETGTVYLIKTPKVKTYSLEIVAKNYGDNIKEAYLKVNIKIKKTVVTSSFIGETIPHHRSRRSVSINPLLITATPYLKDTYYFGKGETIVFKITMSYNGSSGANLYSIQATITSEWLTLSNPVKHQLENAQMVGEIAIFTLSSLSPNDVRYGNVSGTVKNNVGPLSSLYLKLTANSDLDSVSTIITVKSSPTVYSVFPEVNVTRATAEAIPVYQSLPVKMYIRLPLLNYTFNVEVTTNIEGYVFMEIRNVIVNTGGVIHNGSGLVESFTSPGNTGIDRVTVDFGYLQVSQKTNSFVNISFDVLVNDHPLVANGSIHWFGVGLQAGPNILWVEQQEIQIIKIEPALELNVSSSSITNFTKFYIKSTVNVTFQLFHAATSLERAKSVSITFAVPKNLIPIGGNYVYYNETTFQISPQGNTLFSLNTSSTVKEDIEFEIQSEISPLLKLPIVTTVEYKNKDDIQKRPVTVTYDKIVTGTPRITFNVTDSDIMTPGNTRTFRLTILLLRMKSPLKVEIIMPKANGYPVLTILSLEVDHIGENIKGLNTSSQPIYRNSTSNAYLLDQAMIDLGVGINEHDSINDGQKNQVILSVRTIMNENNNITNSSKYWIGAGVRAEPHMVWIGQTDVTAYISPNRKPYLNISLDGKLQGTSYLLNVSVHHFPSSDMFAYNVSLEYFLAPFMEFLSVEETSDNIQQYSSRLLFQYARVMYFTEQIKHSIKIKLHPSKSLTTGTVPYSIPVRVSYSNKFGERNNYMKSISNVMKVIGRNPIIPKSIEAKQQYYGRGFYLNADDAYVCMNQHVSTSIPACYISRDGSYWAALDLRIGCVLGHTLSNELYAIARNQITYLKYKEAEEDWEYVLENNFPDFAWQFKNIESADFTDLLSHPDQRYFQKSASKEWYGTGEGLFHRNMGNVTWTLAAAWRIDE